MTYKIDAQSGEHSGASPVLDGGGPAGSARVAEECNRVSGQELTEEDERAHAGPGKTAKGREVDTWKQFEVYSPSQTGTRANNAVDTLWVLTWKGVDGRQTVKVLLAAKGRQDADIRDCNLGIAGCVSERLSHLQLISMCALKKWRMWSVDIKNAV